MLLIDYISEVLRRRRRSMSFTFLLITSVH